MNKRWNGWDPSTHPDVVKENAKINRMRDCVAGAVESVVISLELGAPATQLESLIKQACEDVRKATAYIDKEEVD